MGDYWIVKGNPRSLDYSIFDKFEFRVWGLRLRV